MSCVFRTFITILLFALRWSVIHASETLFSPTDGTLI